MRLLTILAAALLAGCSSVTLEKTLDAEGKLVKTKYIEETPFKSLMIEMQDKNICWYNNGWYIDFQLTFVGDTTYVPTFSFRCANANSGHLSFTKDVDPKFAAECIKAMNKGLDVQAGKDGIVIHNTKKEVQ